ncbi:MAG: AAA family ATPase [Pirellulales bacterium]
MGKVLRLVIVDPNDGSRESLKSALLNMDSVWLEAECSRYEFFPEVVEQSEADVAVIAIDHDPDKSLPLVERISQSATASVLVLSKSTDGTMILRSMRAGAKEFLTLPICTDELSSALDRISSQRAQFSNSGDGPEHHVIAIAGASGGVGSTSLAVNLGCALAADEANSVALVDLDLSLGDADVFLDTIPDYTLVDVAQNVARLDYALLKKSMTKHSSGLYLLPRPVQLQEAPLITADELQRVTALLKATFTHVIFDLSKSYGNLDLVALEEATDVLLVTQLDVPCLRNVVRLMMSFEEIEGLKDKTRIVCNRVGLDTGQIGLKKAQETIGREFFWQIPNDYRVMVEVRNNGIPLLEEAPKANITQSICGLAAAVCGVAAREVVADKARAKAKGRWIPFLSGSAPKGPTKDEPRK